jgi:hypothetical protein
MPRVSRVEKAQDDGAALVEQIATYFANPLGFVLFAFPWGKSGTVLHDEDGPDDWQVDVLLLLGTLVERGMDPGAAASAAIQVAVASGHGVGKSALVAWIILWFISTRANPQIVVTANTTAQLTTKTWRELSKWWKLAINKDWFTWTATKFYFRDAPETWFASAIPWSKEKSEAFAGTHEKHVLIIFDEASAIDDAIWEVAEGAMTTEGAMWIAFGNPTKNTGRFRECWRKFRSRWQTFKVDSRTAKKANKAQISNWISDYGEDSDFVRIRVRGEFPRQASNQLISEADVELALRRHRDLREEHWEAHPIIVSVDVARFGSDQSVILVRQGPKIHETRKFRELDTTQLAFRVAEAIEQWDPDAVMVDVVGIGAGVVDTLRDIGHSPIEVNGSLPAFESQKYFNRRTEMYVKTREWLRNVGALEPAEAVGAEGRLKCADEELQDDLLAPEYTYTDRGALMRLESKEDMKGRGLPSPDTADALSMTFFVPVQKKSVQVDLIARMRQRMRAETIGRGTHMSR